MSNNILFAFYPIYVKWNHGIALLSALCKLQGIKTDLYLLDNRGKFRAYLESNPCKYVGFSCVCVHDFRLSLPFMEIAKEMGCTVLLGGVYPRHNSPIFSPADHICRGYGELLPYFLDNGDAALFESPQTWEDLNSLPLPDYDLFKGIPYNREIPFYPEMKKILSYHSSRGCPYRCHFCQTAFQPPGVQFRTRVEEDLSYLISEYKPDVFWIADELLPYYYEPWRESWGNLKYPFAAYIRADISEKQLIWCHDHGMIGCFFGVEAADETYRNTVLGKKLSDKDLFRTVGLLEDMDIPFIASYITNSPGETWRMRAQTEKLSRELGEFPIFYHYENLAGV